jgi:hypothetical protein
LQEAGSRAIEADEQQRHLDALKLYKKALEIINEGLNLQVYWCGSTLKRGQPHQAPATAAVILPQQQVQAGLGHTAPSLDLPAGSPFCNAELISCAIKELIVVYRVLQAG